MSDPFTVQNICRPGNNGTGFAHIAPDCADGKHRACTGHAWCFIEDTPSTCDCACHTTTTTDRNAA